MRRFWRTGVVVSVLTLAAMVSACGKDDPPSAATSTTDFEAALEGAPAALREQLYSRPSALVDGGKPAFERTLAKLRGYPVVVNKWASWCGPCRFEFPFFQEEAKRRGKRIAFMAVDGEDGKGRAREFLSKYPVPYPSFFDEDGDIAKLIKGDRAFPVTAFYDRNGELIYTKQGGYSSAEALANDIEQYAR
jgi:cytochrome c biogenesis protein CcmG, thiol:disulfide interchange protein DsbE